MGSVVKNRDIFIEGVVVTKSSRNKTFYPEDFFPRFTKPDTSFNDTIVNEMDNVTANNNSTLNEVESTISGNWKYWLALVIAVIIAAVVLLCICLYRWYHRRQSRRDFENVDRLIQMRYIEERRAAVAIAMRYTPERNWEGGSNPQNEVALPSEEEEPEDMLEIEKPPTTDVDVHVSEPQNEAAVTSNENPVEPENPEEKVEKAENENMEGEKPGKKTG